MYVPPLFAESRVEVLHELVRAQPLGALVTVSEAGIQANHIPFELDPEPAPFGTLRAHVARANPVWRDSLPEVEPLVIFQGPHSYISPAWYPTKQRTGEVVPTYNYAVVHACGPMRVIEDAVWLRALVGRLTDRFETEQATGWRVEDAPDNYVSGLLHAIVGLEMPITRLIGKWKVSQNRPAQDREGVAQALREAGNEQMAALVERAAPE